MLLDWDSWLADFSNYGWWEVPAVITALLYILLAARKDRRCFIYGLISSAIYVYLTIRLKLYFDSFINAYYIAMSVYGWIDWSKADVSTELDIKRFSAKKLILYILSLLVISLFIGFLGEKYTDDSLPYWDAFTTVFSLLATYWVVKRYLENWLIWIVVDLVSAVIYLIKGLPLTSLLFLSYTIMAWYGYKNWRKTWQLKNA